MPSGAARVAFAFVGWSLLSLGCSGSGTHSTGVGGSGGDVSGGGGPSSVGGAATTAGDTFGLSGAPGAGIVFGTQACSPPALRDGEVGRNGLTRLHQVSGYQTSFGPIGLDGANVYFYVLDRDGKKTAFSVPLA